MTILFTSLLDWMPTELGLICSGVIFLFFFMSFLHLICFILDLIPFL